MQNPQNCPEATFWRLKNMMFKWKVITFEIISHLQVYFFILLFIVSRVSIFRLNEFETMGNFHLKLWVFFHCICVHMVKPIYVILIFKCCPLFFFKNFTINSHFDKIWQHAKFWNMSKKISLIWHIHVLWPFVRKITLLICWNYSFYMNCDLN